jgi:diguanylate cyclase (GGDEF)-like protein
MMRAPETGAQADHRGVAVCAVLAIVAVVIGVTAVVADEALLGLAAAVVGVAAAGVGALIDLRRTRVEDSLWEARSQARRLRRQLDALEAAVAEEQLLAHGGGGGPAPDGLPAGTDTDGWEIDPASGLLREQHLPVLLQQVVAAARRKVLPVSVVFWELDGLGGSPPERCDQALTALGAVAWRTLRESDAVFRLGDVVAVAVLVDTAEPGAKTVADRVRDALRSSPVGDSLTVSAGIACYPTHALDAAELVSRAGRALEAARAAGHDHDHVAVATGDQPG